MSEAQVRRLPVIDADENLLSGIVSLGDLSRKTDGEHRAGGARGRQRPPAANTSCKLLRPSP